MRSDIRDMSELEIAAIADAEAADGYFPFLRMMLQAKSRGDWELMEKIWRAMKIRAQGRRIREQSNHQFDA